MQHPCDWLFAAARAMARVVYAEETELDRPGQERHQSETGASADQLATLVTQLEQLWAMYQPGWRGLFGSVRKMPEPVGHSMVKSAP